MAEGEGLKRFVKSLATAYSINFEPVSEALFESWLRQLICLRAHKGGCSDSSTYSMTGSSSDIFFQCLLFSNDFPLLLFSPDCE